MSDNIAGMTIHVSDIERCREFYEALGFAVRRRDGVLDADFLEVMIGDLRIAMRPAGPFHPATTGMTLVVAVDDRSERFKAAIEVLDPGATFNGFDNENVTLGDPDGRFVRLVASASNDARDSAPCT